MQQRVARLSAELQQVSCAAMRYKPLHLLQRLRAMPGSSSRRGEQLARNSLGPAVQQGFSIAPRGDGRSYSLHVKLGDDGVAGPPTAADARAYVSTKS